MSKRPKRTPDADLWRAVKLAASLTENPSLKADLERAAEKLSALAYQVEEKKS